MSGLATWSGTGSRHLSRPVPLFVPLKLRAKKGNPETGHRDSRNPMTSARARESPIFTCPTVPNRNYYEKRMG